MRNCRTVLSLILAACLLCATGCLSMGPASSEAESENSREGSALSPGDASQPTDTAPAGTENLLTGLRDMKEGDSARPVGIMLGNNDRSRPQTGIDRADGYIEAETEGGITRIMALFANASRVPEALNPIRSARTHFVKLAQSLDLIYIHAGGSRAADEEMKKRDMAEIDALRYDGSSFWRDAALRSERGFEYSLTISGQRLTALIGKQNFRASVKNRLPFSFSDGAASGEAAGSLQCKVSAGQTVNFKYYPDEGLYYKRNGTLDNPSTHASSAGVQLSASNVIVLFDRLYQENETTVSFDLKEGDGILFTGGKRRPLRWSRTDSALSLTESDGSAARLARGKSYILLVNRALREGTFSRE